MGKSKRKETSLEDLMEMARRLSNIEGGLKSATNDADWRSFVSDKLGGLKKDGTWYSATAKQITAAEEGRRMVFDYLPNAGVQYEFHEEIKGRDYLFRQVGIDALPSTGLIISAELAAEALEMQRYGIGLTRITVEGRKQWAWAYTLTGDLLE